MPDWLVTAEVELFPSDWGGLQFPIEAGNRSLLYVFGDPEDDTQIALGAVANRVSFGGAKPGRSSWMELRFWSGQASSHARRGATFEMWHEGRRVGRGEVIDRGYERRELPHFPVQYPAHPDDLEQFVVTTVLDRDPDVECLEWLRDQLLQCWFHLGRTEAFGNARFKIVGVFVPTVEPSEPMFAFTVDAPGTVTANIGLVVEPWARMVDYWAWDCGLAVQRVVVVNIGDWGRMAYGGPRAGYFDYEFDL